MLFLSAITIASIITSIASLDQIEKKHFGLCQFYVRGDLNDNLIYLNESCTLALFSNSFNFSIDGYLDFIDHNLCTSSTSGKRAQTLNFDSHVSAFVVVKRGQCSFEEKFRNAISLGYRAVLVINNVKDIFPPGADGGFISKIEPCLMLGSEFIDNMMGLCSPNEEQRCQNMMAHLEYNKAPPVKISPKIQTFKGYSTIGLLIITTIVLTITCYAISSFIFSTDKNTLFRSSRRASIASIYLCCIQVIALSLLLRVCTLRVVSWDDVSAPSKFNHRETDERIFQTLIEIVSQDPSHYTLQHHPIIKSLRLAEENYSDTVFIHPPIFVYLSALLQYLGLSALPLIPLLFHAITALCIPAILLNLDLEIEMDGRLKSATTIMATVIFCLCPICGFCSQKIWIDNALLMTVTISATFHLYITRKSFMMMTMLNNGTYGTCVWMCVLHLLSGLLFGGIALNTKIAALAMLPFLIGRTIITTIQFTNTNTSTSISTATTGTVTGTAGNSVSIPTSVSGNEMGRVLRTAGIYVVMLLVGVSLGHAPWMWYYWTMTGRILPNAWPSPTMVSRSKYLQTALAKSTFTYPLTLLKIAPIHVIALTLGLFVTGFVVSSIIYHCYSIFSGKNRSFAAHPNGYFTPARMSSCLSIFSLFLWPVGFICGFTLLGVLGAGYQTRFLLPIFPATSVLAAIALSRHHIAAGLGTILLCIGALHYMYYAVLFSPLYADLDHSIWDIIDGILDSPYYAPPSKEIFDDILKFMRHFGFHKSASE